MIIDGMLELAVIALYTKTGKQQLGISENEGTIPDFWYFLWDEKNLDEAMARWRMGRDLVQRQEMEQFRALDFGMKIDFTVAQSNAREHRHFMQTYFPSLLEDYDTFLQVLERNAVADDVLYFEFIELSLLGDELDQILLDIKEKFETIHQCLEAHEGQFRMTENLELYGTGGMDVYSVVNDREAVCCRIIDNHLKLLNAGERVPEEVHQETGLIEEKRSNGGIITALLLLGVLLFLLLYWLGVIRF